MGRLGISLSEHNRREAMFARKLGDLGYMVRIGRYGRWATLVPQVSHLAFNYGHPRKRDGVRVYSRIEALGRVMRLRKYGRLYDFQAHLAGRNHLAGREETAT